MTPSEQQEYLRRYGHLPISGGSGEDDPPDDEDDEGEDEDDEAGTDQDKNGTSPKSKTMTQAQIDAIVRRKLAAGKTKLRDEIRNELVEEAKREKAKKDGNLQAQLDAALADLGELKTLKEMVLTYDELAEERFQAGLAELPEALQEMAPDDDADPIDKERWLIKAQKTAAKMKKSESEDDDDPSKSKSKPKITPKPGLRPNDPKNQSRDENRIKTLTERFRRSADYKKM